MRSQTHRCTASVYLGASRHCIDIDDTRMIVRRGTLWMIALLLLLARIVASAKPRSRPATKVLHHHQELSRTESTLVSKNSEGEFAHQSAASSSNRITGIPYNYLSRTRRNYVGDYYSARRNAERRAVMERYDARQREINARYAANRTGNISGSRGNDIASQHRPVTRNATLFNPGHPKYPDKRTRDGTTFRYPYIRIEPMYNNESWSNGISTEPDNRRDITPETNFGSKSGVTLSQTSSTFDYYNVTPAPCTNVSLSGTFAPKTRTERAKNGSHETERKPDRTNNNNFTGDYENWGTCEGKIVYQHNLLLGLKGPSNLDTLFEAIIRGPICITCVEVLRYNETRATVTLDSGGRGHEFVKIRLKGYENEGFSYIIKVWGVEKIDQNCYSYKEEM